MSTDSAWKQPLSRETLPRTVRTMLVGGILISVFPHWHIYLCVEYLYGWSQLSVSDQQGVSVQMEVEA